MSKLRRTSKESHILAYFLVSNLIFKKCDKFIFIWINSTLGWELGVQLQLTRVFVQIYKIQFTFNTFM